MDHDVSSPPSVLDYSATMLKMALYYASKNVAVLPLHSIDDTGRCTCGRADCGSIGKHPLTQHGVKDATRDAEVIRQWWQSWPFANVGVATGHGVFVIDIDPRHGGTLEALAELVDIEHVSLAGTGGSGWHIYFKYEKGVTLSNTAGKLGAGIDTRGKGGYVVAPPSLHASGNRYHWINKCLITPIPEALLTRLQAPPQPSAPVPWVEADAAPSPQTDRTTIAEGTRNSTLVSLAGTLRQWGADNKVLYPMLQVMNKTCCQPVLPDGEVKQIARSAARWEQGEPPRKKKINDVPGKKIVEEEIPDIAWAIPGLLPEGVTLLGGKPKKGKTYLAMTIALGVAGGWSVLGRPASPPGRTLFLGMEEPRPGMRVRLRIMLGTTECPDLFSWFGECSPILNGGLEELEDWVRDNPQARLIVIDTLERVRSENSGSNIYSFDYKSITPLKLFAERHHLSVLIVHHLRKGSSNDPMEEFSGSLGLTGSTDCNMVLHREPNSPLGKLYIVGNYVDEQEIPLIFTEKRTWELSNGEQEPPKALSPERLAIINVLRQEGRPLAPLEIAQRLGEKKSARVRSLLYEMKDGQVFETEKGYMLMPTAIQSSLLTSTDCIDAIDTEDE